MMSLLCLPMLSRVLYHAANPINHIIRPVANYLDISNLAAGLLITALAAVVAVPSMILASTGSLIAVLSGLSMLTAGLALLSQAVLVKQLYDLSPAVGIMYGAYVAILQGLQLLIGVEVPAEPVTLIQALTALTASISQLGLNVLGNIGYANLTR